MRSKTVRLRSSVLRDGTNLDRRSLFVSAAAFGALAAAPAFAQTTPAPARPLLHRRLPLRLRAGSS